MEPVYKYCDVAKMRKIHNGDLERCTSVQIVNPGEAFVHLDSVKVTLDGLTSQSSPQMYPQVVTELTIYFDKNHVESPFSNYEYSPGDLVICIMPWKRTTRYVGQRAVVLSNNWQVFRRGGGTKVEECYTVSLLDLGGTRIISKGGAYLLPLPERFLKIPPLAVQCSLHGITGVEAEWPDEAIKECAELMSAKKCEEMFVEFIEEVIRQDPKRHLLPPLFRVEVIAVQKKADATGSQVKGWKQPCLESEVNPARVHLNVATELIRKELVLGWNPFPTRSSVYRKYFDAEKKEEDVFWNESKTAQIVLRERGIWHAVNRQGSDRTAPPITQEMMRKDLQLVFKARPILMNEAVVLEEERGDLTSRLEGNVVKMRFERKVEKMYLETPDADDDKNKHVKGRNLFSK